MSSGISTAKIYRLPSRPRVAAALLDGPAQVVELRPSPAGIVHCPAVSYHEAAIAEAARLRKA